MKRLISSNKDVFPLLLLIISLGLLITGVSFKNLVAVAGVGGVLIAWFLCIDTLIANRKMHIAKQIAFAFIVISLPVMFVFYLGAL